MSLANLTASQVSTLIKLLKKKEKLESRLSKLEKTINSLGGTPAKRGPTPKAPAAKRGRKPRKTRKLKGSILAALKAAGSKGVAVGALAKKIGVKPGNVFSWFYTTGRKVKGLKKSGPAHYTLAS
jgi:hypothetical protein